MSNEILIVKTLSDGQLTTTVESVNEISEV